jgi:chaperonin cofactor prefoldin
MADPSQLDNLVKRRDALKANQNRLLGRLESAKADLTAVEDDCRKRGIPPEKLGDMIVELDRRYNTAVTDLSDRIVTAENQIKPFTEGGVR